MKRLRIVRLFAAGFAGLVLLAGTVSAHPGRTDANGGHYDSSTGLYHYHHGYPAHQHENGVCPYEYDDQTGTSSGSVVAATASENCYEDFYNQGYSDAAEDILRVNDYHEDMRTICENVLGVKLLTGSTTLSSDEDADLDAYDDGYKAAVSDIAFEVQKLEQELESESANDTEEPPAAADDKADKTTLLQKIAGIFMILGIAELIVFLTRFTYLWRISRPSLFSIGLSNIFTLVTVLTLVPAGLMRISLYLDEEIKKYHRAIEIQEERRKEEHRKAVEAGTELHTLEDLKDLKDNLFR